MFLASASSTGLKVSLWDITNSPTEVATRDAAAPAGDQSQTTKSLAFSRDGQYLAVATSVGVEVWSLPCFNFTCRIRHEEKLHMFSSCTVKFNYSSDKFLTIGSGRNNKVQVWTTESGVCLLNYRFPWGRSAQFLPSDDILYLVANFDCELKNIEAVTLNIKSEECTRSSVAVGEGACDVVVWDSVEADHAVIVSYRTNECTRMVGRWNLQDDILLWRWERRDRVPGELREPVVSPDGRLIAVYDWRELLMIDMLCALSGNFLRTFPLNGCYYYSILRFLPDGHDAVASSWMKFHTMNGSLAARVMSVHNFLTGELKWEMEFDFQLVAVQNSMFTVLM
jgi:WD40 repeat protein